VSRCNLTSLAHSLLSAIYYWHYPEYHRVFWRNSWVPSPRAPYELLITRPERQLWQKKRCNSDSVFVKIRHTWAIGLVLISIELCAAKRRESVNNRCTQSRRTWPNIIDLYK